MLRWGKGYDVYMYKCMYIDVPVWNLEVASVYSSLQKVTVWA